ncbi:MAG: hypothetical protein H6617_11075 [Bdellovibrionaceae bacterium]|nr:hypothetical protein [Bdellovibrionales bacterium]MCB9255214.1 hypothetical protein [Pseudobdellovibrionaceae bacterium]
MKFPKTIRRPQTALIALVFVLSLFARSAHFILVPHTLDGSAHVAAHSTESHGSKSETPNAAFELASKHGDADACHVLVVLRNRGELSRVASVPAPSQRYSEVSTPSFSFLWVNNRYGFAPKQSPPFA